MITGDLGWRPGGGIKNWDFSIPKEFEIGRDEHQGGLVGLSDDACVVRAMWLAPLGCTETSVLLQDNPFNDGPVGMIWRNGLNLCKHPLSHLVQNHIAPIWHVDW